MFSLETINKIVQSGNIAHPLTFRICPFEWFQYERYTKRTNQLQEWNANERKTKNERTIHADEMSEKRKRYEISVNLNDPGYVTALSTAPRI